MRKSRGEVDGHEKIGLLHSAQCVVWPFPGDFEPIMVQIAPSSGPITTRRCSLDGNTGGACFSGHLSWSLLNREHTCLADRCLRIRPSRICEWCLALRYQRLFREVSPRYIRNRCLGKHSHAHASHDSCESARRRLTRKRLGELRKTRKSVATVIVRLIPVQRCH